MHLHDHKYLFLYFLDKEFGLYNIAMMEINFCLEVQIPQF
jgi:hypothetical protein